MSAQPVDVLAVMDAAVGQANGVALDHSGSAVLAKHRDDMREARAAVAELIDKAETAAQILHNVIAARQIGEGYQSNLDDLNAALARVQGGA